MSAALNAALNNLSSVIGTLSEIFLSIFSTFWGLIEGNWYLLAVLGLPLVGSVIFSIKNLFDKD